MKELTEMSLEELWQLFPIILKEHNPAYRQWYEEEKRNLMNLLHDCGIYRISHIGSTAVEGLIAKPIVDILVELSDSCDLDQVIRLLQDDGWILMIENRGQRVLSLNKGYTAAGFAEQVYHLHVRPPKDWNELYFRDYLRQYPDAARQYETLKLSLKEQYEHNRDAYTDAKTDFIKTITARARAEFQDRYRL